MEVGHVSTTIYHCIVRVKGCCVMLLMFDLVRCSGSSRARGGRLASQRHGMREDVALDAGPANQHLGWPRLGLR